MPSFGSLQFFPSGPGTPEGVRLVVRVGIMTKFQADILAGSLNKILDQPSYRNRPATADVDDSVAFRMLDETNQIGSHALNRHVVSQLFPARHRKFGVSALEGTLQLGEQTPLILSRAV